MFSPSSDQNYQIQISYAPVCTDTFQIPSLPEQQKKITYWKEMQRKHKQATAETGLSNFIQWCQCKVLPMLSSRFQFLLHLLEASEWDVSMLFDSLGVCIDYLCLSSNILAFIYFCIYFITLIYGSGGSRGQISWHNTQFGHSPHSAQVKIWMQTTPGSVLNVRTEDWVLWSTWNLIKIWILSTREM